MEKHDKKKNGQKNKEKQKFKNLKFHNLGFFLTIFQHV